MTVLITGGGGYLGSRLARHLPDVLVTVRPGGSASSSPTTPPGVRRVTADLAAPDPLRAVDPARITHVVHAAAATRFDIDAETAHRANVAATGSVLAFARRCPRLETFTLLSTVYAAGLASGPIPEAPVPDHGFANHYEQSKWAAEQAVVADVGGGAGFPWRIARLATVVADDPSGAVTQHNAFHRTLDLWFHGLLPVLPGDAQARLPVITARFATDALAALLDPARRPGVYHLAPAAAPTLTEVVELVTAAFEEDPAFRRRRVSRPLFADHDSFELLAGAVGGFPASLAGQAVAALRPFARQLYSVKDIATGRLAGVTADEPRPLITATARHLVRTRWGRRPNLVLAQVPLRGCDRAERSPSPARSLRATAPPQGNLRESDR